VFYVLEQVRLPGNAIRITFLDTCTSQGFRSTMIEVTEACDGGHQRCHCCEAHATERE
jgi:hypothetical protein